MRSNFVDHTKISTCNKWERCDNFCILPFFPPIQKQDQEMYDYKMFLVSKTGRHWHACVVKMPSCCIHHRPYINIDLNISFPVYPTDLKIITDQNKRFYFFGMTFSDKPCKQFPRISLLYVSCLYAETHTKEKLSSDLSFFFFSHMKNVSNTKLFFRSNMHFWMLSLWMCWKISFSVLCCFQLISPINLFMSWWSYPIKYHLYAWGHHQPGLLLDLRQVYTTFRCWKCKGGERGDLILETLHLVKETNTSSADKYKKVCII